MRGSRCSDDIYTKADEVKEGKNGSKNTKKFSGNLGEGTSSFWDGVLCDVVAVARVMFLPQMRNANDLYYFLLLFSFFSFFLSQFFVFHKL